MNGKLFWKAQNPSLEKGKRAWCTALMLLSVAYTKVMHCNRQSQSNFWFSEKFLKRLKIAILKVLQQSLLRSENSTRVEWSS